MQVRPLYDRILVKRVEQAVRSQGGLFLPESATEKPSEGVVLATGAGHTSDRGEVRPLQVQEGDLVVFGRFAGTEIKVDGEDRLVMREDEIFGIIES
jgi:chaperonin GroES